MPTALLSDEPVESVHASEAAGGHELFRLRPVMRQGTASSIAQTWVRYRTLEEARLAVKQMYHDDRVLRVFIVTDEVPPQFVEWVER